MRVGVVGLGYVGLPLAVAFAESGREVIGVDTDPDRVAMIGRGESYAEHVPAAALRTAVPRLRATGEYAALAEADAVVLAVPTPLDEDRAPDLGPLTAAASALSPVLRPGQLVSIESTTYPGCTRERVLPLLQAGGLDAGEDFHLAFSPERLSIARPEYPLHSIPKVVGGLTEGCLATAVQLFGAVYDEVVPVGSLEAAETTKLLENAFRFVNVSLVNELSVICDRLGIDVHEVIDAAETKPFGFMRFDPGPGAGGHCLPVDSAYLAWRARELGAPARLMEAAIEVDRAMPRICLERIRTRLNEAGRSLEGASVLVVGVTYKPGIADLRESPVLDLADLLVEAGARVTYHDPLAPTLEGRGLKSAPLEAAVAGADLIVLGSPHPDLNLDAIAASAAAVEDLRGALRRAATAVAGPA